MRKIIRKQLGVELLNQKFLFEISAILQKLQNPDNENWHFEYTEEEQKEWVSGGVYKVYEERGISLNDFFRNKAIDPQTEDKTQLEFLREIKTVDIYYSLDCDDIVICYEVASDKKDWDVDKIFVIDNIVNQTFRKIEGIHFKRSGLAVKGYDDFPDFNE